MSGGLAEMTGVVEASLQVVSSSRKLPRFVHIVVEVFPAAREGKLQHRSTFQASFCIMFAIVPLTNASHMAKPILRDGEIGAIS